MVSFKHLVVFSSPLVALTACGGGGSGGSAAIVGLEPPAAMEVITVDTQGGAPATVAARAIVDFAPDCDYNTDASREHVWDPAIRPIATINEILCYMSQTGAADMVNTGPYNAQLDEARCQTGSDPSSSSEGQSSGGNAVQPSIWVVDSTRADNDSPQLVDIWVPGDNQGGAGHIYVQCTINAGPTTANPYGDFFMNFAGTPDVGGDIDNPNEWGTLSTTDASGAQTGFSFYQSHGDVNQVPAQGEGAETTAVTVQFNADQTAGQARLSRLYRYNDPMGGDTGIQSEEFLLDVAGDEVLRQLGNDVPQCYSRTQFNYNTYRYNLYELDGASAGQRVELNSGFPIRKNGYYGWLGYWGVWMPPAADLQNGDIVERVEYGSATASNYTIVQAPGKLIAARLRRIAQDHRRRSRVDLSQGRHRGNMLARKVGIFGFRFGRRLPDCRRFLRRVGTFPRYLGFRLCGPFGILSLALGYLFRGRHLVHSIIAPAALFGFVK